MKNDVEIPCDLWGGTWECSEEINVWFDLTWHFNMLVELVCKPLLHTQEEERKKPLCSLHFGVSLYRCRTHAWTTETTLLLCQLFCHVAQRLFEHSCSHASFRLCQSTQEPCPRPPFQVVKPASAQKGWVHTNKNEPDLVEWASVRVPGVRTCQGSL